MSGDGGQAGNGKKRRPFESILKSPSLPGILVKAKRYVRVPRKILGYGEEGAPGKGGGGSGKGGWRGISRSHCLGHFDCSGCFYLPDVQATSHSRRDGGFRVDGRPFLGMRHARHEYGCLGSALFPI